MGVAVETGDTEADGELKPMGKFIFIILVVYIVGGWAMGACAAAVEAAGWAAMGVAVETGDMEADGELKPMGKLIFVIYIAGVWAVGAWTVGAWVVGVWAAGA